MSPRAACRLERFGFREVYDYVPGKAAWLAAGLPSEGRVRDDERISSIARTDVPLIGADSSVGAAAGAMGDADVGVVVDDDHVVLGLLRHKDLDHDPDTPVLAVARPAPSTFRPSMAVREMVEYFGKGRLQHAIVSTLDGVWIGLIRRRDLLED